LLEILKSRLFLMPQCRYCVRLAPLLLVLGQ
jgi:hypothetical protein